MRHNHTRVRAPAENVTGLRRETGARGCSRWTFRICAFLPASRRCKTYPPSARELGLTPGTISKRIQALEDELSARLFDRTTRSIRITEEGATFLGHVERILSEIEMARASVDDA